MVTGCALLRVIYKQGVEAVAVTIRQLYEMIEVEDERVHRLVAAATAAHFLKIAQLTARIARLEEELAGKVRQVHKGGVANAPHAGFAGGVLTPPLTRGNAVPSGLPYFLIGDRAASCAECKIQPRGQGTEQTTYGGEEADAANSGTASRALDERLAELSLAAID